MVNADDSFAGRMCAIELRAQSELLPQRVDAGLRGPIHQDFIRPRAIESFSGPLPCRVNAHFRTEILPSRRVIQRVALAGKRPVPFMPICSTWGRGR